MASLREAAHPLSRDEFEHGVEMPHGAVPGTANEIDRNCARIDIIGSTGRLGHLTADGLSKQDALDAVWKRYLFLSKSKSKPEKRMRSLVKETLNLIDHEQVERVAGIVICWESTLPVTLLMPRVRTRLGRAWSFGSRCWRQ